MGKMSRFTNRDKIWNNALMQETVTPSHYTDVFGVTEQMAAETLETMHRMGLLERDEDDGEVTYSSKVSHPKTSEGLLTETMPR
jgi:hypothetical protein